MCNAVQSFHWTSGEFKDRELSLHTEIVLFLQGDLREKILFAVSQCIYIPLITLFYKMSPKRH